MSPCLHPCPSCAQHLRATETVCPFCAAALPSGFGVCAQPNAARGRPVSRAALLFVGATAAAGCGGTTQESTFAADGGSHDAAMDSAGDEDTGLPVALYGPGPIQDGGFPRPDASQDAAKDAPSESGDEGGGVILYGPAPFDGGAEG
jgi:hypothetical protein